MANGNMIPHDVPELKGVLLHIPQTMRKRSVNDATQQQEGTALARNRVHQTSAVPMTCERSSIGTTPTTRE